MYCFVFYKIRCILGSAANLSERLLASKTMLVFSFNQFEQGSLS